jgi:HK97 family phage major capsid protein
MNQKIREIRDQRNTLATQMRAMMDKADAEKRELSTDERSSYDQLDKEFDKLDIRLKDEERLAARESEMRSSITPEIPKGEPGKESRGNGADEKHLVSYRNWLKNGPLGVTMDDLREFRAIQADADVTGGYLVMPQQMVTRLIAAIDNEVIIRKLATVIPMNQAASLGVPTLDSDVDDFDWTGEISAAAETADVTVGKRELKPHPLSKLIKISNTLMRQSFIPVDQLVIQRMGYKVGVTQEKGYMTGSGHNQPLGIFTASADGITTARDVQPSGEVTASAVKGDAFISLKAKLPASYWRRPSTRIIVSRDLWSMVRKLKTGAGDYIWGMGLQGQPDTIVDIPMIVSEYCPATFSASQYVAAIGDFSYYWIADAMNPQIQRLNEHYAITNQTGFIGRYEGDGMPVLAEAFARLKLAAS